MIKYPKCENCINFIPNFQYTKKSDMIKYGFCKKFGEYNDFSKIKKYCYVEICRKLDYLCDKTGKYYEKTIENVDFKIIKKRITNYLLANLMNDYFVLLLLIYILMKILSYHVDKFK
jgi:hypothetical protein